MFFIFECQFDFPISSIRFQILCQLQFRVSQLFGLTNASSILMTGALELMP
jgi:hypothetical protein